MSIAIDGPAKVDTDRFGKVVCVTALRPRRVKAQRGSTAQSNWNLRVTLWNDEELA